jgi:phospholipase D1/2
MGSLSPRSYQCLTTATSWKEIWEAGPYYERVSTLLEGAQRYAIFTGWQIDSRLPMSGGPHGRETLKEKVLRLCAEKPDLRIYFLMWDHSYFYVAEREFWQGRIWDLEHPRIHFIFDNRHPFGGAHHEKIILFDGTRALCGGIDLCDDRWDSPEHLYYDVRRSFTRDRDSYGPYHDLAVEISGPVCQVLQANISRRWRALSDVPFPELPPIEQGAQTRERSPAVYVSRTQSDVDASRKMVREIEFLFRDLIGSAERRILLEGQYFWSREITDLLIAKMQEKALERARAPELPPFELVIILAELGRSESFTRMMAGYEGSLLRRLYLAARSTGTRLTMGTPYAHAYPGQPEGATAPPPLPIYVHSKLVLIDDRYLCVGSANFAARALRIDTEINLTFEARTPDERSRLRALHTRILEHWGASPSGPRSEPSNIHLHPFTPEPGAASSRTITLRPPRSDVFLMSWLFDPTLPWGYLFKKRLHSIARRKPHWIGASTALIAMLSTLAALGLSGAAPGWAWVFAGLMASAWLLPVPFFLTAWIAALTLGAELGARLAVISFWIAATLGYLTGRVFPSQAHAILGLLPVALRRPLGARTYGGVLRVLFEPRALFRAKVLAQGVFCIPLPWFLVATGLVAPSLIWTACRWIDAYVPQALLDAASAHPAACAATALAATAIGGLREAIAARARDPGSRLQPPSNWNLSPATEAASEHRKAGAHAA